MNKKIYLAGPITGYSYGNVTEWREGTKKRLEECGLLVYSPMRGKAYLSKEDRVKDSYADHTMSSINGINVRDYNDVKTSGAILVNLVGSTRVSIGTVMEIAWARAFQIPVVIIMDKSNIHDHGMLTFGNIVVQTIEEGESAIKQIVLS